MPICSSPAIPDRLRALGVRYTVTSHNIPPPRQGLPCVGCWASATPSENLSRLRISHPRPGGERERVREGEGGRERSTSAEPQ